MTWELNLQNIFLDTVNLSITASWVIIAVLLLRLILKPVPKKYVCLLWLVVLVRLLCPLNIESPFGLVPQHDPVKYEIVYTTPQVETQVEPVDTVLDQTVNPVLEAASAPTPMTSANPLQIYIFIAACIWIIGMFGLCGYTLFSWLRLRRQVEEAELKEKGVYLCGTITSPFVFGVIRPKIYVPYGMSEEQERNVLLHERSHIARKDFIVKPLFWLAVMIHWMNPLVWIAWYYFGRDIELACDERATDQLTDIQKCDYSTTLVQLATQPKCLHCPMAFGNNSVKQRIKRVLEYKKLPIIALDMALILVVALGIGLLADQKTYFLGEQEQLLIESGFVEEEYKISRIELHWGSVLVQLTEQEDIAEFKNKLDKIQIQERINRSWSTRWRENQYENITGKILFYDENGESLSLNMGILDNGEEVVRFVEGFYWRVISPDELQELLLSYCQGAMQYQDTTFYADLNHDGIDEAIIVNVSEWEKKGNAELAVYGQDGSVLYTRSLSTSHAGWGNYFLGTRDGKDYLVEFCPTIYQGVANYSWQLMDFDSRNELRIVEQDSVEFTLNAPMYDFDVDDISAFIERAEQVIRPAMLLISTDNGELEYSTTQQYHMRTAESFINWWLEDTPLYLQLTPEQQEQLTLKEKLEIKREESYYQNLQYELWYWLSFAQKKDNQNTVFVNPKQIAINGEPCVSFEWRWNANSANAGQLIDIYAINTRGLETNERNDYNYYRYDASNNRWLMVENGRQREAVNDLALEWGHTWARSDGQSRYDLMTDSLQQQINQLAVGEKGEAWMPYWNGDKQTLTLGGFKKHSVMHYGPEIEPSETADAGRYQIIIDYEAGKDGEEIYKYAERIECILIDGVWKVSACESVAADS